MIHTRNSKGIWRANHALFTVITREVDMVFFKAMSEGNFVRRFTNGDPNVTWYVGLRTTWSGAGTLLLSTLLMHERARNFRQLLSLPWPYYHGCLISSSTCMLCLILICLICLCSKEIKHVFFLRSNGPFTPNNKQLRPTTNNYGTYVNNFRHTVLLLLAWFCAGVNLIWCPVVRLAFFSRLLVSMQYTSWCHSYSAVTHT